MGTLTLSDKELAARIRMACEERGWGPSQLARRLGILEGRGPKGLDRKSAWRWMEARRRPEYWLPYIDRLLELGLDQAGVTESDHPGPQPADTVGSLIQLGVRDVQRRRFLAATSGYALSALALPDLDAITRRVRSAPAGAVRVGKGEVAAVKQMVQALGDAAAELGGGHARHLAVRYLTDDVAPWLNGHYTEATGRELFAATSQLVHLAGWMAQDEGNDPEHQGRAQQYYAHAYRLAAEAKDPELAATALRGLAVQTMDLGPKHRAVALRLSEKCVEYAKDISDPRVVAYYEITLADAAALDGDRRLASRSLTTSQTAIERATSGPGESWASHFSHGRWAYTAGMIHAKMGDLDGAEEHLRQALEIHGLDRRRSRASVLGHLGEIHLRQGDLDGALATWTEFLDCAEGVRSVKVLDAAQNMQVRLERYKSVVEAEQLRQRAAHLTGG
ncbi:tetratricopeptide repeat protein [Streptomyces sp. UNOC14_S4]|uniref:tetratricopeptide repeat protein n=1 Tax=Streptomyces sp. UNOC14_S4 TaxID=2872340 RepID=UPI001E5D5A95|nr:tetratricopeptide repeat protein [Streptomyces sp. UNOC14_S4]